ncbi:MAG: ABC transporter ATP-binding protein [Clostridia bacterium]|nr:ABC transporter ATP-binding protein [Clostridia bacterium]
MKKEKINIRPFTKQFYKGNALCFLMTLLESVLSALGALLVSWLLQQLVDIIGGAASGFSFLDLSLISLVLIAGVALTSMIGFHFRPQFIVRGISQYKNYVFSRLTEKSISAFSGENATSYISALTNDIPLIETGYLKNVFTIVESVLMFTGAIALMVYYSPLLTLIAILLSLLPLILSVLTGNKVAQAEKRVSDQNEVYTLSIKDVLGGFSVVKSFQAEKEMIRIFKENVSSLASQQCCGQKMRILVALLGNLSGRIAQLGVFLFGAYLALSGKGVTAGTTIVFVQLMNFVLGPIGTLPTCFAERKAAKTLIEKVAQTLGKSVREEKNDVPITLDSGITIKNLSFGYEEDNIVLDNISCFFESGKKHAVVGTSGSGKSTLLNLLMASYCDYDGEINYDDTEIRQIGSGALYNLQSIIQQNVFVFNATIRENITMFKSFPDDEIDRAVELSGLKSVISEKGEDYLCGENGSGLSGGEKQRISIARSLLKKSKVLLVDEATSSLDKETAYQVSEAILNLNDITLVVVTHALEESLLKKYDAIITLKNGKIAETGTFDDLIEKKGYFYSLFTVSQ